MQPARRVPQWLSLVVKYKTTLHAMTKDEMRSVLSEHLAKFRSWTYTQLAGRVDRGPFWKPQNCLEHVEGTAPDGTEYQMEFHVDWNDKPNQEVRVFGSLSADPQKPLLGFIPIYTPDATDSFVMATDGRFLFEHDTNVA